jgi:hypothetical protein
MTKQTKTADSSSETRRPSSRRYEDPDQRPKQHAPDPENPRQPHDIPGTSRPGDRENIPDLKTNSRPSPDSDTHGQVRRPGQDGRQQGSNQDGSQQDRGHAAQGDDQDGKSNHGQGQKHGAGNRE